MLMMGTPGGPNWKTLEALGAYATEVNMAVSTFDGSVDDYLLLADMLGMKGLEQFPTTGLSKHWKAHFPSLSARWMHGTKPNT